jgi:hypothetical protein
MKFRVLIVGLALPLVLIAAKTKDKEKGTAAWKEFTSKEGGFVVLMPGVPVEDKKALRLPSGPADLNLYVVERKKEETAYIVAYCELPETVLKNGTDENRLDYAQKRAVASTKGKLAGEKKIKLGTYPGRELRFEVEGKGEVRQRIYAAREKVYQLMVAGPKEMTDSKDADKFFQSFKLKS